MGTDIMKHPVYAVLGDKKDESYIMPSSDNNNYNTDTIICILNTFNCNDMSKYWSSNDL